MPTGIIESLDHDARGITRLDGKTIFVEGTYTSDFSGNPFKTPRYDYNQMLYRIDLDDPRLKLAHAK